MKSAQGYSLIELMIVVAILGILFSAAVPRFEVAFEQARIQRGASKLRTIWLAQRMFWLENKTFSTSLRDLVASDLIARSVLEDGEPFRYSIETANEAGFVAQAERVGSSSGEGTLTIDEKGDLEGWMERKEGAHVIHSAR